MMRCEDVNVKIFLGGYVVNSPFGELSNDNQCKTNRSILTSKGRRRPPHRMHSVVQKQKAGLHSNNNIYFDVHAQHDICDN